MPEVKDRLCICEHRASKHVHISTQTTDIGGQWNETNCTVTTPKMRGGKEIEVACKCKTFQPTPFL